MHVTWRVAIGSEDYLQPRSGGTWRPTHFQFLPEPYPEPGQIHARPDYARIQDPAGKIGEDEPVMLFRRRTNTSWIKCWPATPSCCSATRMPDQTFSAPFTIDRTRQSLRQDPGGCKTPDLAFRTPAMTDLAALADELRERLNAIAYAKAIHGQDPTDTTWPRYETASGEAADWLYGKGDELQAALRASRPEPAADAVETAYREGYRTRWRLQRRDG